MSVNSLCATYTSDNVSSDSFYPKYMYNKYADTIWWSSNTVTATPVILPSQQIENNSELKINIKKNPIKFNFNL